MSCQRFAVRLAALEAAMWESLADGEVDLDRPPREHLLPLVERILGARQDLGTGYPQRAAGGIADAALHLAAIAFPPGGELDTEARVSSFLDLQRQRFEEQEAERGDDWSRRSWRYHYDRSLANAVSVSVLVDARSPSLERLHAQAADAANYLLLLLERYEAARSYEDLADEELVGGGAAA